MRDSEARPNSSGAPQEPAADDQPFRHYSLQHRAVAWISQTFFDNVTYTVRHGLIEGMKRKGGLGWLPQAVSARFESKEEAFWKSLKLTGLVVYDIGAFHGILTLFFSRNARRVISYEPNSRTYTRLMDNLNLNRVQNVTVRKFGLGSRAQTGTLVFLPLMAGGGSLEQKTVEHLKAAGAPAAEEIRITTLDEDIEDAKLPPPGFIKIDVEGWEIEVLRGAKRTLAAHRPALFLEMHGETMNEKRRKVAEIVAFLEEAGYSDILHVETGSAVTPANSEVAVEGHLYCRPVTVAAR